MEKSEIGNKKAGNLQKNARDKSLSDYDNHLYKEKIIKSYGEGRSGEWAITRWDGWLHFSFWYEDIINFTILVCSSHTDDGKSIEKAIIGFCDTIIEKHPGKIFDKEKCEIIKIWKNPEWMPSEDISSDGLMLWRGLTNFFSLDYDTYKIELITYQQGAEIIGIDVLKEAFAKFAEIYAEEKHLLCHNEKD